MVSNADCVQSEIGHQCKGSYLEAISSFVIAGDEHREGVVLPTSKVCTMTVVINKVRHCMPNRTFFVSIGVTLNSLTSNRNTSNRYKLSVSEALRAGRLNNTKAAYILR